ncbi:hypothetical protein ACH5RR_002631 [Cinchona calisaya]|uniref:J domain-containing protein n=1 Tax=Cinchona calisaya TaxID=153742 RepID=A0ABD3ASM3_9GENT
MKLKLVVKPPSLLINSENFQQKAGGVLFFHSTSVLFNRRRTSSDYSEGSCRVPQRRYKNFVKGFSSPLWKRILLRDRSAHFDGLVQQNDYYYYTPYSSQSSSWHRQDDHQYSQRSHAFGGSNYSNYWSSWKWSNQNEEKRDYSKESENSKPVMTSERLALGLSTSGPLTLDEVKNAYHACAMKWHPDHNQGLLKAWSNGRVHSTLHCVRMSPGETRFSTALFSYHNGTIQVPKELVDDDHPLPFKPFDHLGFFCFTFSNFSLNDESKIRDYCSV